MKPSRRCSLAVVLAGSLMTLNSPAESLPPGQIDFGNFAGASKGGEFVEVNVTSNLISFAARLIQKEEPDVAKLLNGLQQVHVTVVGLNDENRSELRDKAAKLRKSLDSKGWERVVTAQKENQDVGVYVKNGEGNSVQGLAVTVMDGNHQAVFVNVVGDVRPEQLAVLGEKLHIDPLQKLGGSTHSK